MTSQNQHQQESIDDQACRNGLPHDEAEAIAKRVQDELLRVVDTIEVPTSPIAMSNADAAAGICFLDLAMNSNHVVKESEHLSLIDRNYLARRIRLDLSLNLLTPDQRDVAVNYNYQRHTPGESTDLGATHEEDADDRIWLPVTRVDRLITAKMEIIDDEEHLVPQLAQTEILQVISAAMVFTYAEVKRAIPPKTLSSKSEQTATSGPGEQVPKERIEEKEHWLIRAAIATIVQRGADFRDPDSAIDKSSDSRSTESAERSNVIKERAERFIKNEMSAEEPHWQAFYHLLYKVATEYVIIAGFDWKHTEHQISYNAPALPSRAQHSIFKSAARLFGLTLLFNDSYCIQYTRECKTSLREFHIDLETEFDVNIRAALLTTDRDEFDCYMTEKQNERLRTRVAKLESCERDRYKGVVSNEANRINAIMSFIADRRRAQLDRANKIRDRGKAMGQTRQRLIDRLWRRKANLDLPKATQQQFVDQSLYPERERLEDRLHTFDSGYLGMGATVSDDQRQNIAHAFWNVSPEQLTPRASTRTYRKTFAAVLADDQPSYVAQVAWLLFGLLVTVMVIGGSLFHEGIAADDCDLSDPLHVVGGGVWRFTRVLDGVSLANADALVAVLLIVPGILLNRLENSPRDLVLQWLRLPARNLAYYGVFSTTALSLAIALFDSDDVADGGTLCAPSLARVFLVGTYFIAFLTILAACGVLSARVRMKHAGVPSALAPKWLPVPPAPVRVRHIDGKFEAVGSGHLADAKTEDRTGELLAAMSVMFLPRGEDVVILARMVPNNEQSSGSNGGKGLTLQKLTELSDEVLAELSKIIGASNRIDGHHANGRLGESKEVTRQRANRTEVSLTCGPAEPALVFVSTTAVPGTLGADRGNGQVNEPDGETNETAKSNGETDEDAKSGGEAPEDVGSGGQTGEDVGSSGETDVGAASGGEAPEGVGSDVETDEGPESDGEAVKPPRKKNESAKFEVVPSLPRRRSLTFKSRSRIDIYVGKINGGETETLLDIVKKYVTILNETDYAVLSYIEWPAVKPYLDDEPAPGSKSGTAVLKTMNGMRLGFDVENARSDLGIDLLFKFVDALDHGLTLSSGLELLVRDSRGPLRDHWRNVYPLDEETSGSNVIQRSDALIGAEIVRVRTFVGPIRAGTTNDLLSLFDKSVVGLSESTLDRFSVISVWYHADKLAPTSEKLLGIDSLKDYHVLWEDSDPIRKLTICESDHPLTIWCNWNVPMHPNALKKIINALDSAFSEISPEWSIVVDYADTKLAMPGRQIGLASLRVTLEREAGDRSDPDYLSKTCRDVQNRWRRKLEGEFSGRADVQVVWRDSWLRRWSHRR